MSEMINTHKPKILIFYVKITPYVTNNARTTFFILKKTATLTIYWNDYDTGKF